MLLDNVEIPHVNFLAGYASVDPDTGKFNRPQHDKLAYGTMVYIRASELPVDWFLPRHIQLTPLVQT